ncbi:triphosphoribosyl-dephospho-CoA synthase MdcB [Herminiimonas sp. NPDC097707]|uniref:triphosphoribosyl-dephospho-CoA synthase MdcB n=1 Tax=Herminiimonas sp. NPDC097707 TaxID=3364007 RepID=UPI00383AD81F
MEAIGMALIANTTHHLRTQQVARAAVRALYDEMCLYPKPGLVSKTDNGSHDDMQAATFVKSLFSLRHYFAAIYQAGVYGADFAELTALGLAAEATMLRATAGVNTHRGAIFNLGLLCAALGKVSVTATPAEVAQVVVDSWGADIKLADSKDRRSSHGNLVCRKYAVGGARGEAVAGFPHVFKIGLPALVAIRHAGGSVVAARCQAFFAIMAALEDTNLLHRAGIEGLHYARNSAISFLAEGGVFAADWQQRAVQIHNEFVARRLSPGGSADLLAATLFVAAMTERSVHT